MTVINFNYSRAINQASQVDLVASEMLSLANRQMQTTIDSLGVAWRGEAARQFIGGCAATQADIRNEARRLQNVAKRIREVAGVIRAAEEKAKELQLQKNALSQTTKGSGGGRF